MSRTQWGLVVVGAMTAAGMGSVGSAADTSVSNSSSSTTAADDAAMISDLLARIAAHQEEIFSAQVKYRWTLVSFANPDNTPERVRTLLPNYDLLGDPDSLRDLVTTLGPEPAPGDPPWETRTFSMLGDKRRADTSQNVIQLVDSEHEMTYEGTNSQLRIEHRGRSSIHRTMIEDFRSYPPPGRYGLKADDFRIVGRTGEQLTLEFVLPPGAPAEMVPSRFTFDLTSGVMTHSVEYVRDQLDREIWQLALTEYPGGIVMPALRIAAGYRKGRLNSLRVFIIEEAEYNGPVPEDRFVMPVAAGTVLVDDRFPETRVGRTKSATDDVRSILAPVGVPAGSVPPSGGPRWRIVLILNGIALIIVAAVLWRRASQGMSNSPPSAGAGPSASHAP